MTPRTIRRGGLTFHVEESEATAWGFWNFFESGQWEPPTLAAAERLLKPGDLLLDVGAWVGPLTLWAAAKCNAQVIAYEPDPVAFEQLQQNVTASGLDGFVSCVQKAVALTPDVVLHTGIAGGLGYSSIVPREALSHSLTVECVSLLKLAQVGAALVKMDIEGGEAEVLSRDGYALRAAGIPLLLATHHAFYTPKARAALEAELEHWTLVEDLENEMWLYEPRKS